MAIIRGGKATRPSGLHAVLDSQRAERYQARHPEPSLVERESRRAWLWVFLTACFICAAWFIVEIVPNLVSHYGR